MVVGNRSIHHKFDDIRVFAVSTNFGVLDGKLKFDFLLPISTYKRCYFYSAAGDLGVLLLLVGGGIFYGFLVF